VLIIATVVSFAVNIGRNSAVHSIPAANGNEHPCNNTRTLPSESTRSVTAHKDEVIPTNSIADLSHCSTNETVSTGSKIEFISTIAANTGLFGVVTAGCGVMQTYTSPDPLDGIAAVPCNMTSAV